MAVYTLLPSSSVRFADAAFAAQAAGQHLYFNGRTVVRAVHAPSKGWHRIGIPRRTK